VQGLLSSQKLATSTPVPLHVPPLHVSPVVHLLPSLHGKVLALYTQPLLGSQESLVHGLPSSHVTLLPAQKPPEHLSPWLQALPSSHPKVLFWNAQLPVVVLQLSVVQGLLSLQLLATPALHAEAAHASPTVQALPSLHGAVLAANLQPALASQLSSVHGLPSLQLRIAPALHTPPAHASPTVHTDPSASQLVPLLVATKPQLPLPVLHTLLAQVVLTEVSHVTTVLGLTTHLYGKALLLQNNVPLHRFPSSWPAQSLSWAQAQVLVPLLQVPLPHTSPLVQPLPSSQLAVLLLWAQPLDGTQLSVVQGLPSSQSVAALTKVPAQALLAQMSLAVQALPSLQATLLAPLTQPLLGSQLSLVQTLLSLHDTAAPLHDPPLHASFWLQALPSSQGRVLAW
jgi:hypothetical protein